MLFRAIDRAYTLALHYRRKWFRGKPVETVRATAEDGARLIKYASGYNEYVSVDGARFDIELETDRLANHRRKWRLVAVGGGAGITLWSATQAEAEAEARVQGTIINIDVLGAHIMYKGTDFAPQMPAGISPPQ